MSEYADLTDFDSLQLDRGDLQGMSPEDIDKARRDGRLNRLLENPDYVRDRGDESSAGNESSDSSESAPDENKPRQLTPADLQTMSLEEIHAALKAGQLTDLLGN